MPDADVVASCPSCAVMIPIETPEQIEAERRAAEIEAAARKERRLKNQTQEVEIHVERSDPGFGIGIEDCEGLCVVMRLVRPKYCPPSGDIYGVPNGER